MRNSESNRFNLTIERARYKSAGQPSRCCSSTCSSHPGILGFAVERRVGCPHRGLAGCCQRRRHAPGRGRDGRCFQLTGTNLARRECPLQRARLGAGEPRLHAPGGGDDELLRSRARHEFAARLCRDGTGPLATGIEDEHEYHAEQQARTVLALSKLLNPQYFYAVKLISVAGTPTDLAFRRMIWTGRFKETASRLLRFSPDFSREYFPKYSWALDRRSRNGFQLHDLSQYTDPELQRLYQDEEPNRSLPVIASGLRKPGSPLSKTFAMEGLLRMGPRIFCATAICYSAGSRAWRAASARRCRHCGICRRLSRSAGAVLPEPRRTCCANRPRIARGATARRPVSWRRRLANYWRKACEAKCARAPKLTLPPKSPTAGSEPRRGSAMRHSETRIN